MYNMWEPEPGTTSKSVLRVPSKGVLLLNKPVRTARTIPEDIHFVHSGEHAMPLAWLWAIALTVPTFIAWAYTTQWTASQRVRRVRTWITAIWKPERALRRASSWPCVDVQFRPFTDRRSAPFRSIKRGEADLRPLIPPLAAEPLSRTPLRETVGSYFKSRKSLVATLYNASV
jgi:hypothetical protein